MLVDLHGPELEQVVEELASLAVPAARLTWIFTSLLSSRQLLRIEDLLPRTKVSNLSIHCFAPMSSDKW